MSTSGEITYMKDKEPTCDVAAGEASSVGDARLISAGSQQLHRKLRGKEVQLFAVGGAIGTCTLAESQSKNRRGIMLM